MPEQPTEIASDNTTLSIRSKEEEQEDLLVDSPRCPPISNTTTATVEEKEGSTDELGQPLVVVQVHGHPPPQRQTEANLALWPPITQVETSSSLYAEELAGASFPGLVPRVNGHSTTTTTTAESQEDSNNLKHITSENERNSPPQSHREALTSNHWALSPSRSSLLSSIASSSSTTSILNGEDPERNTNIDDDDDSEEEQEDDGAVTRLTIDPALLVFGGCVESSAAKIMAGTAAATSTCIDDKSFRSVESRPDPPSVVDGKDQDGRVPLDTVLRPMDHLAAVSLDDANTDPPLVALNGQGDVRSNEHVSPVIVEPHPSLPYGSDLDVLSPENFAAHALTSLSEGRLDNQNGTANSWASIKPTEESALVQQTSPESLPVEPEFTPLDEAALLQRSSLVGPDNLVILPRVDENRFYISPPLHPRQIMAQQRNDLRDGPSSANNNNAHAFVSAAIQQAPMPGGGGGMGLLQQVGGLSSLGGGGRRKIRLRLQEEVKNTVGTIRKHFRTTSLLGSLKRNSSRVLRFGGSARSMDFDNNAAILDSPVQQTLYRTVDRGTITVSWYDGTSSLELQQHVRKTILRKLKLESTNVDLDDVRILDETVDPPEEIVLSPYIPDGSQFLLRFNTISPNDKLKTHTDGTTTPRSEWSGRPPVSPSAAPSPHPEKDLLSNLNANQLALLKSMKMPSEKAKYDEKKSKRKAAAKKESSDSLGAERGSETMIHPLLKRDEGPVNADEDLTEPGEDEDEDDMMLHSEDPIEARLRQITDILLVDRKNADGNGRAKRQEEKRQVIFVVANYFVLFLALIAVSAELQMRAPNWLKMMEEQLQSVQNCGGSQEALYECISRGDFAGLIASLILWLSRSVATRRFFLFGFDTPKKLWTVVYESLVTSLCWGISYLFIRRGMNPDTRPRFVQKYWKDAVYGSLAGFNAAFLKHVLKNLIPQEVVEDAIRERHLKVLGWLPSFFA